jgi:hypothetical protein
MMMPFDQSDYSVVVKHRAPPPTPWRWEIYRAGRASAIEQSSTFFPTMAAAGRAGKQALKQFLDKRHSEDLPMPRRANYRPAAMARSTEVISAAQPRHTIPGPLPKSAIHATLKSRSLCAIVAKYQSDQFEINRRT